MFEVRTETVQQGDMVVERSSELRCKDGHCEEVIVEHPQRVGPMQELRLPFHDSMPAFVRNILAAMMETPEPAPKDIDMDMKPLLIVQAGRPMIIAQTHNGRVAQGLLDMLGHMSHRPHHWSMDEEPRLRHWAGELDDDGPSMPDMINDAEDGEDALDDDRSDELTFTPEMRTIRKPSATLFQPDKIMPSVMLLATASGVIAAATLLVFKALRCGSAGARDRPMEALSRPLAAEETLSFSLSTAAPQKAAVAPTPSTESKVFQSYLLELYSKATVAAHRQVVKAYLSDLYARVLSSSQPQA